MNTKLGVTHYAVTGDAKWLQRGMTLAELASSWSKAPTQVGACLVAPDFRAISLGYNGFPHSDYLDTAQDIIDDPVWRAEGMVHAELNAILNAAFEVHGCFLFSTVHPCLPCAAAIINAGVVGLVSPPPLENSRWRESQLRASSLLEIKGLGRRWWGA